MIHNMCKIALLRVFTCNVDAFSLHIGMMGLSKILWYWKFRIFLKISGIYGI